MKMVPRILIAWKKLNDGKNMHRFFLSPFDMLCKVPAKSLETEHPLCKFDVGRKEEGNGKKVYERTG